MIIFIFSGIIIGIGISWFFRFLLKRKFEKFKQYFNDEIDALQEEIIYLEKVINILNEDIDILYNEEENKSLRNINLNIDDIIDKVNEEGINSLSEEQKRFLDKYSK